MPKPLIIPNKCNFIEEIFIHAQHSLNSFYTDCMILTQPPDGAEVIALNDYLKPERLISAIKARSEFAELSKCTGPEAIETDYSVLYEQPYSSVMTGRNPLYNLVRTEQLNEPGLPTQVTVRLTCSLYTFIPPFDEKCANCPLIEPQERIALIKEELAENS